MTVAAIIARYSSLSPNSVRAWRSDSIEDIESAILFVLATWSGPSVAAFLLLTKQLASRAASPLLLVCDIDELSDQMRRALGELRGVGETFWIEDGQVVASLREYTSEEWIRAVDEHCALLRAR